MKEKWDLSLKNQPQVNLSPLNFVKSGLKMFISIKESNYADSFFYNSNVFNYPTIDEQKKLARSIAQTLEGSNPATSKYHKKKQNVYNREDYESEVSPSGYYSSGNDPYSPSYPSAHHQQQYHQQEVLNNVVYDETLPDVIKRSIVQASMTDPVCMVQAPDYFKQQHFTEHVSHTEMPPQAAMSLAAALENDQNKGGRGAHIFQKRKARSEKWVVDDANVKKVPGQDYQQSPPTPQPIPQVFLLFCSLNIIFNHY